MDFFSTNILDTHTINDLEDICEACGYEPFYVNNISGPYNHFFYAKENNSLVSFIGIMPVDKYTCEITGLTIPSHRHNGIFSAILKSTLTELNSHNDIKLLSGRKLAYPFVCNVFSHSEYLLRLSCNSYKYINIPDTPGNIFDIICYSCESDNIPGYTYVLMLNNIAVGILTISPDENLQSACIHHVKIRKKYRGLGYGKRLLTEALNLFFDEYKIPVILHVTGTNSAAVKLYKSAGFETISSVDYYLVRLKQ